MTAQIDAFRAELQEQFDIAFAGQPWIVMAPDVMFALDAARPPERETLFVAALNPVSVKMTEHMPTGTQLALIETEYGYVLRFSLTIFDDPANPFELRLPLNPVPAPGAGPHLTRLAGQEWMRIIFFDAVDGSFITVRNLPMDEEFRSSLRMIVAQAAQRPTTPERWRAAVAQADPYL